jgi:lipoate-protein ligase B
VPFEVALEWQKTLHARRVANEIADVLLLLEHPHVYSLGRRFAKEHLIADPTELESKGIAVFESDRGGSITYHGPGQLVAYPIVDLRRPDRELPDSIQYLRLLEESIIRTLRSLGVISVRRESMTGVWVGDEKLAAIGVNISQGVTRHGLAINVSTDLSFFDGMVPCGLEGLGVTSLERLLGTEVEMEEVKRGLASKLSELLHRVIIPTDARDLGLVTTPASQSVVYLRDRKTASG